MRVRVRVRVRVTKLHERHLGVRLKPRAHFVVGGTSAPIGRRQDGRVRRRRHELPAGVGGDEEGGHAAGLDRGGELGGPRVCEEARLSVPSRQRGVHRVHVEEPLERAPVGVDAVVEHVGVDATVPIAIRQRRRRHEPRRLRERAHAGQHQDAPQQHGQSKRRAERRGLAQQP